jgi:hypothetical protein
MLDLLSRNGYIANKSEQKFACIADHAGAIPGFAGITSVSSASLTDFLATRDQSLPPCFSDHLERHGRARTPIDPARFIRLFFKCPLDTY